MSLKQQIDNDIKKAMLEKNKDELTALRSIKSLILLAETEKGGSDTLAGDIENKLLMKAAKQRKESAEIFQKENREDLAKKELLELAVNQPLFTEATFGRRNKDGASKNSRASRCQKPSGYGKGYGCGHQATCR